jgi:DNA-binding response OmpR family regulator
LEILATTSVQLIISDVRLPGRNGLSLFEECRERWPEMKGRFFFITGDPGSRELHTALEKTGCPVLRKPFSIESLAAQAAAFLPKARGGHARPRSIGATAERISRVA